MGVANAKFAEEKDWATKGINGVLSLVKNANSIYSAVEDYREEAYKSITGVYNNGVSDYVSSELDAFSSNTYDEDLYNTKVDEIKTNITDAEYLANNFGGSVKQAERYIQEHRSELDNLVIGASSIKRNQMDRAQVSANAEAMKVNAIQTAETPQQAVEMYNEYTTSSGVNNAVVDRSLVGGLPENNIGIVYQYQNNKLENSAMDAVLSGVDRSTFIENEKLKFQNDSAEYLVEGNVQAQNAYNTGTTDIEKASGTAYDHAVATANANAESKNVSYQQRLKQFTDDTGKDRPSITEVYEMMAEVGFDYNNPFEKTYIDQELARYGYSEAGYRNEKVRNAIATVDSSYFYNTDYRDVGVYKNGEKIDLEENEAGYIEKSLDAYLTGDNYIVTGMQGLINKLAKEQGIEEGTEDYMLLVRTVDSMEESYNAQLTAYNERLLSDAYYSNMSNEDFESLVCEMAAYGGITPESRTTWLGDIGKRQTVYTQHVTSARDLAKEYIKSLSLYEGAKAKLNINLFYNPNSDLYWEQAIYANSPDPKNPTALTSDQIEKIVNTEVDMIEGDLFASDLQKQISSIVEELGGQYTLSISSNRFEGKTFNQAYQGYLDGTYRKYDDNEAINAGKIYLLTPNNEYKVSELFDAVAQSMYGDGVTYSSLDDAYKKEMVQYNASVAAGKAGQLTDLKKVLFGSSDADPSSITGSSMIGNGKYKEAFVDGYGAALMDSEGNVFVISSRGAGTNNLTIQGFYYPPSTNEYKSVWSGEPITLSPSLDSTYFQTVETKNTGLLWNKNEVFGNGLMQDDNFIAKIKEAHRKYAKR